MRCDAPLWASGQKFRQPITVKLLARVVSISPTLLALFYPILIAFVGQCWKRWLALAKSPPHFLHTDDPLGHSHHPLPSLASSGLFVYCTLANIVEMRFNQPISYCQSTGRQRYTSIVTFKSFKGKMHWEVTKREPDRETNCVAIGEEEDYISTTKA